MKKKFKNSTKYIFLPLGGAACLLFFNLFFQAPPGRAEYDADQIKNEQEHKNLDDKFSIIKEDLTIIKRILLGDNY